MYRIIEHIQKQQLKSSVIDKSILVTAIKSCSAEDAGNENINTVNVIK